VWRIKWGTVFIITAVNIMVMCIWIPAHMDPPPSKMYGSVYRVQ
jgi:hypothetical protein